MTTTSSSASIDRTAGRRAAAPSLSATPLRALLVFDASTCVALGAVLVAADRFVARITGLPPALLAEAGLVLLVFAACLAAVVARRAVPRMAVLAIVDANLAWAVASVVYVVGFADGATPVGRALVAAQGVAVAALATLEFVALRRASPRAGG